MARKLTNAPARLPPDAGVTFEGFEGYAIPSRELVRRKIDEFLRYALGEAVSPSARAIVGEWGEGKTEAYDRYVGKPSQQRKFKSCRILASTLERCLAGSKFSKLLQSSTVSSVRFLGALFLAAREEDALRNIPNPEDFSDISEFVESCLDVVCGEGTRLVCFIDEFEEVILSPNVNDVISGIKEVINPPVTPGSASRLVSSRLHSGGKNEGGIHLIVACTPDAFYRLQTHEDYNLMFGGLGRRWGVIELLPVTKSEGTKFLQHLLGYCYKGDLPEPLPFESTGVVEALLRVSQRNPGILVSLLTRLLNSAREGDKLAVVDADLLLQFFKGESISISTHTPCLETGTLDRLLRLAGDQRSPERGELCLRVLQLLIGEPRPFSIAELEARLSGPGRSIKDAINEINSRLRSEGLPHAILKVSPLREGRTVDDFQDLLAHYTTEVDGKKQVRIDNFTEPLASLLDRLHHPVDLRTEELRLALPTEADSVAACFEGIGQDDAQEIAVATAKRLCSDSFGYLVSDAVLDQVYPIPVPKGLDFVRERNRRFKLWRDVTRELSKRFDDEMPGALVSLIAYSDRIKASPTRQQSQKVWVDLEGESIGKVRSVFFAVNGDVKVEDVEEVSRLLRSSPPCHLVVLLYTGDVTPSALDKLVDKGLSETDNPRLLSLKLHPTLIKKLLVVAETDRVRRPVDDPQLLASAAKDLLEREIELTKKLENWEQGQEAAGKVLTDPPTGATLRDFIDSVKYFVNYPEGTRTVEDRFESNREELLRFVLFKAGLGLVPDIETVDKLKEIVQDLVAAKFLTQAGNCVALSQSPVEREVLRILQSEKKLNESDLEGHFVIKAKGKNLLSRVYLPILHYKGLVEVKGEQVSLADLAKLVPRAIEQLREYEGEVKDLGKSGYGHIFQVKERGDRLILLSAFDTWARDKLERAKGSSGDTGALEANLLLKLLSYFRDDVVPMFWKARQSGATLVRQVGEIASAVRSSFEDVAGESSRWFGLKVEVQEIEELVHLNQIAKGSRELHESCQSEKELLEWAEGMAPRERSSFFFSTDPGDAHFFNLKVWKLEKQLEAAKELKGTIDKHLENLTKHFNDVSSSHQEVAKGIKTFEVDPSLQLSSACTRSLRNPDLLRGVGTKVPSRLSISYIARTVRDMSEAATGKIRDLRNAQASLVDELAPSERTLAKKMDDAKEFGKQLSRFNVEGYSEIGTEFSHTMEKIAEDYQKLATGTKFDPVSELPRKIGKLRRSLDELASRVSAAQSQVESSWIEYRDDAERFIRHVEGILAAVSKKEEGFRNPEITQSLAQLSQHVRRGSIKDLDTDLRELDQLRLDIRNKLYKAVAPFLDEQETKALEVVITRLEQSRVGWIPFSEVYQEVKQGSALTTEQTNEVLQRLIKKKYLRGGVTLIG